MDQFENHRGSQTEIVKNECWCKKTYPLVDMGMRSKICSKKIKVDQHQDDQEAQEDPPSTRMFLMAFQHYRPYVLYIFGNLG